MKQPKLNHGEAPPYFIYIIVQSSVTTSQEAAFWLITFSIQATWFKELIWLFLNKLTLI